MRLVITGTPGTGKSSLARGLGKLLHCSALNVNALIRKERLFSRIDNGEMVADFPKLRRRLVRVLKARDVIIESHLLSDLKLAADVVIVLRCRPRELRKRLARRRYAREKIRENALSEALDYCLLNSEKNYGSGRVMQVDTTRKLAAAALLKKLIAFIRTGKTDEVRWLRRMRPEELIDSA